MAPFCNLFMERPSYKDTFILSTQNFKTQRIVIGFAFKLEMYAYTCEIDAHTVTK